MIRVRRLLLRAFGGFYNDLIGRRSRLGAAAVIFHPDGRLLLVRHSYGRRNWELPGGGRKANESVEQAVRREVHEEVGVEAVIERLCGIDYEPEMGQHQFAFVCRLQEGATPRLLSALELQRTRSLTNSGRNRGLEPPLPCDAPGAPGVEPSPCVSLLASTPSWHGGVPPDEGCDRVARASLGEVWKLQ